MRISISLAVLSLTLGLGACASSGSREGTAQYAEDVALTARVKAAIFAEPSIKASEINVECFKGTVQLSGFVSSQADIDKAIQVARGVNGVASVKNDMRLK